MNQQIALARTTATAILRKAQRREPIAPLRRAFVQGGDRKAPKPGPLAGFVKRNDKLALQLYLLLIAGASAAPYAMHRHARVWVRAMGLPDTSSSAGMISRAWRRLKEQNLVTRGRWNRYAEITVLREDGTGRPYIHPGNLRADEPYLRLPLAYWTAEEAWFQKLELNEIAVLLIALSLPDNFILPSTQAQKWYGLSRATVERGLKGLENHGLLAWTIERKEVPLARDGFVMQRRYILKAPFGPRSRTNPRPRGAVAAIDVGSHLLNSPLATEPQEVPAATIAT